MSSTLLLIREDKNDIKQLTMVKVKFETMTNMRTDTIYLHLTEGMLTETSKEEGRQKLGALQSANNPASGSPWRPPDAGRDVPRGRGRAGESTNHVQGQSNCKPSISNKITETT